MMGWDEICPVCYDDNWFQLGRFACWFAISAWVVSRIRFDASADSRSSLSYKLAFQHEQIDISTPMMYTIAAEKLRNI